jgi:hypothetical protein
MPSSNLSVPTSPISSTKQPKAGGLEKRADEVAQQIVNNLNRARKQKEAAKKQPSK